MNLNAEMILDPIPNKYHIQQAEKRKLIDCINILNYGNLD